MNEKYAFYLILNIILLKRFLSFNFLDKKSEKKFRAVIMKNREEVLMTSWKLRNHLKNSCKKKSKAI